MANFIILSIVVFIYASLIEYLGHRFLMHKRIGGSYWQEHAIEHHKNERVDINIAIRPEQTLIGSIPLYIIAYLLCGWWAVAGIAVFALIYSCLWTALHSSIHDLGYSWLSYIPFYKVWRDHHLIHHNHVSKNFGTIFIWTDYLFGTNYNDRRK